MPSVLPVLGQLPEGGDLVVVGFLGEPEDALADDVVLDLVGAAVDRRPRGGEGTFGGGGGEGVSGGRVGDLGGLGGCGGGGAGGVGDGAAEVAGTAQDGAHGP